MSVENLSDYEYAHKRLSYDPETGVLTWREAERDVFLTDHAYAVARARSFGKPAGRHDKSCGYYRVTLRNKKYLSHRVAWLMQTGKWPEFEIDHINGNTLDNRLINLRDVEHRVNVKNAARRKDNKTGHVGVFWNERHNAYQVYIRVNTVLKHLGYFSDIEDAVAARSGAEIKYGYHENHGR